MSDGIEEVLSGAKVRFGLVQQGHIKTIEDMLDKYRPWEEINKAIGWAGTAALDSYIRYLRKLNIAEQSKNQSLSRQIVNLKRDLTEARNVKD